jgi:hypothetical protein
MKTEVIQMSLRNADTWQRQNNIVRANSCLSSALMNLLSIAVEQHSLHQDAIGWLSERNALSLLRRFYENLERLVAEVDSGRLPSSTYGGNYPYLVYAHLSWALNEFTLGERFVLVSEREDIGDISTPFWRVYSNGMGSLVRGKIFKVPEVSLRGQEEYWVTYLYFIEVVSNGGSPEEALSRIDRAFAARNSDKRIKDDSYETEGSGNHPVRWDYRRDSLMSYIASASGRPTRRDNSTN